MSVHDDVLHQLNTLDLSPDKPLIISDADEVLVQFVEGLDQFLREQELYFDIVSFAITGNVKRLEDDAVIDDDRVQQLLTSFFKERTEYLPAVPGAPEALKALSARAQVIVVSNVPLGQREARIRGLRNVGIDYPVIANIGLKGATISHITQDMQAPVYFLDDIPHNIASVAEHADHVHRIHFVADPRLARLIEPAEDCHQRIDDWPTAQAYMEDHMQAKGF
jgi:hypothetical protein